MKRREINSTWIQPRLRLSILYLERGLDKINGTTPVSEMEGGPATDDIKQSIKNLKKMQKAIL